MKQLDSLLGGGGAVKYFTFPLFFLSSCWLPKHHPPYHWLQCCSISTAALAPMMRGWARQTINQLAYLVHFFHDVPATKVIRDIFKVHFWLLYKDGRQRKTLTSNKLEADASKKSEGAFQRQIKHFFFQLMLRRCPRYCQVARISDCHAGLMQCSEGTRCRDCLFFSGEGKSCLSGRSGGCSICMEISK